MFYVSLGILLLIHGGRASDTTPSASATLGTLYRQARSDQYYMSRYGSDNTPLSSGTINVRADPVEHRDAAYYESRCITCDPNKSTGTDRGAYVSGSKYRPRYDWYDDDLEDRRYRDRYDDYDRSRGPGYDYDRYDQYDRYDRYDRDRYDRDRYFDRNYDRGYDRYSDRGNGYDNLDSRFPYDRYDRYNRRPYDDPYSRYDRINSYGGGKYDRYEPSEKHYWRRPSEDRYGYDRYGGRGTGSDGRGYYSGGTWGPGYDRGYASAWNYGGNRNNWRDVNRDRDVGYYRPRDYFYDSTAAPGGIRGTSYLHERPESSTKPNTNDQDKATSSPQSQDNKVYKD
ncbi:putative carbonic anhydrase 2 isoform X2 [Cephus cinctus]|uniref:Carbonic anhydrase 2 isoform X2 n=1 Tax=Cephus cinctus TaxID=211228 RepID=A0AAJ7RMS4_CEPCN|nr:putative carbonic anhydrase 2 isoform X2 [Cephus cinctus]